MSIFLNYLSITIFAFIAAKFRITISFFATISTFFHTNTRDNSQSPVQQVLLLKSRLSVTKVP